MIIFDIIYLNKKQIKYSGYPASSIQHPVSSILLHFRQNAFVQKDSPFSLIDNEVCTDSNHAKKGKARAIRWDIPPMDQQTFAGLP